MKTKFKLTKNNDKIPKIPSNTHAQQQQEQPFYGPLSGTTQVSRYQKKHSPTILIIQSLLDDDAVIHLRTSTEKYPTLM